jgi:putative ABC transport system permease protein
MIVVRSIFRRKLRPFLTVIGVSIGIAIFLSLSLISSNLKAEIKDIIARYKVDIIVQPKGADPLVMARISMSDYKNLGNIDGIKNVSPIVTGAVITPWKQSFFILGVPSIESFSNRINLVEGRLFTHGKREILLGSLAARHLGYHGNNKIFLTDNDSFIISGVYFTGNNLLDGAAVMDIADAQELLKRKDTVNIALIKVKEGVDVKMVINNINSRFPNLFAFKEGDFIGHAYLINYIDVFVNMISVISVFSCIIVVMNTMFMSVSERTREIGILMAIGWSRFMIGRAIMLEALYLSFFGGILGIIGSYAILSGISGRGIIAVGIISATIPFKYMGFSILMALMFGVLGASIPAFVASKLTPVDALRYE